MNVLNKVYASTAVVPSFCLRSFSLSSFKMTDIQPNHTIYINNLNEKVKKEGKSHSIACNSETFEPKSLHMDLSS